MPLIQFKFSLFNVITTGRSLNTIVSMQICMFSVQKEYNEIAEMQVSRTKSQQRGRRSNIVLIKFKSHTCYFYEKKYIHAKNFWFLVFYF